MDNFPVSVAVAANGAANHLVLSWLDSFRCFSEFSPPVRSEVGRGIGWRDTLPTPSGEHLPQATILSSAHSWTSVGDGGLYAELLGKPLVHALRKTKPLLAR